MNDEFNNPNPQYEQQPGGQAPNGEQSSQMPPPPDPIVEEVKSLLVATQAQQQRLRELAARPGLPPEASQAFLKLADRPPADVLAETAQENLAGPIRARVHQLLERASGGEPPHAQQAKPAEPGKRLYRVEKDRMIAGVCSGLGEYFNIDPVIFRIGFVVISMALLVYFFIPLIVYVAMALVLPVKEQEEQQAAQ